MEAGKLTETIYIYKPTNTVSSYGSHTVVMEQFLKMLAEVKQHTGDLNIDTDEIFHDYVVEFNVRHYWYSQLDETMEIHWLNKKYRILSIFLDRLRSKCTIKTELINE